MDLRVDNDARFVRAATHERSLPAVDELPVHEPPLLDRIGMQLNERWGAVGGLAGVGALAATVLARRSGAGLLATAARAGLGATAGAALAIGVGIGVDVLARPRAVQSPAAARGAAAATPGIHAEEDLRVMSFNLHGGKGEGGSQLASADDIERIARAIERERPDVVLLQELDHFATHAAYRDILAQLAERLDADGAVATTSGTRVTGRESGTGVLTFNGVQVADARGIVSPDAEGGGTLRRLASVPGLVGIGDSPEYRPRTTADVLVTTPAGNAVRVLSGHWNWPTGNSDEPRRQIDPLAGLLAAWQGPTIIGGDFNVRSDTDGGRREAKSFERAGLRDAFTEAGHAPDAPERVTFGNPASGTRIDRIYGSDELDVDGVRVAHTPSGETDPSDHHPLVVDYRLHPS